MATIDGFSGTVILPGDAQYDESRQLFNAMVDKRPRVIAQCVTPEDVARAISYAREQGLEVAVRGGGHGVTGVALAEDGMVIDLRRMNTVTVDPKARTAVVGGGATISNLDRGTEPYGLAVTGGRASTTGVGGFTLGGGSGWFERKYGLACDNLLEVELVTADGKTVTASEKENQELFWALHGGGGNFGVATSFTFALHPLSMVTVALMLWPPSMAPELAVAFRDFFDSAPNEVGGGLIYLTGPEAPFVPEHLQNQLLFGALVAYAGPRSEAMPVIEPMLKLGHEGGMVEEMPYADFQCMLDDPPGHRNYWSAEYLSGLPDEAITRFCDVAADMIVPSPSMHAVFPLGGVLSEPTAWPVPWRGAPWAVHPFGVWTDPADDERAKAWSHSVRESVMPWSIGAVYLNFIAESDRVVAGFGEENYQRLVEIKRSWDPDNLFHLNHNISPAVG
jgi:FAD/FMN-containing dehydrogenase